MDCLIVCSLLYGLNLENECHNLSCSIPRFYASSQLVSLIESTQLVRVLWLDQIIFVCRLKWIYSNSPFLIPDHYLYSDVLPFTSTWKMVKDTPNHILKNMIGSSQISRKILKDSDIIMLLVVLIDPKDFRPSV